MHPELLLGSDPELLAAPEMRDILGLLPGRLVARNCAYCGRIVCVAESSLAEFPQARPICMWCAFGDDPEARAALDAALERARAVR